MPLMLCLPLPCHYAAIERCRATATRHATLMLFRYCLSHTYDADAEFRCAITRFMPYAVTARLLIHEAATFDCHAYGVYTPCCCLPLLAAPLYVCFYAFTLITPLLRLLDASFFYRLPLTVTPANIQLAATPLYVIYVADV